MKQLNESEPKKSRLRIRRLLNNLTILSLLCILSTLFSCENWFKKATDDDEILKTIKVNPRFEKSPPIAKNISLEILKTPLKKGQNVKIVVEFEGNSLKEKFLAINLSDEKIVLRDDGKGADDEQSDGKFSVFQKIDIDELKNDLRSRKKIILSNKSNDSFINRRLIRSDLKRLEQFDIEQLERGRLVRLPLDILIGRLLGNINHQKSLLVNSISVVEDPTRTFNPCTLVGNPNGVWTFGELMRQLASPGPGSIASDAQVSTFTLNWLNTWMTNQTVNGENLPARTQINNSIIQPWLTKSANAGAPSGQLKMEFAPFKLLAIVNRLDLRGNSGYGFSNAGEGRFVFGALNTTCNDLRFTVIFEYGINKKRCTDVKVFAQEWADLSSMTIGSTAYNQALEDITLQFSQSGTNSTKPNQSSLNQIRTNEIAFSGPWELREFNLTPAGQLGLVTVKQEPAVKYNTKVDNPDVARLAHFINSNATSIENNNYEVPEVQPVTPGTTSPTTAFLGGKSHTQFPPTGTPPNAHHWNGTPNPGPSFVISDEARHIFSLNTCSGCHGGETQTFFTHIDPVPFGTAAPLSGFLTGISVIDAANRPIGSPTLRTFADLQRREDDLSDLINSLCINRSIFELSHHLLFEPIRMVH